MDIKEIRKLTNLKQKEFCQKYHIPLKTLQNWEAKKEKEEHRECPDYVLSILEKEVRMDYD